MAQRLTKLTSIHEDDTCLIPGLTQRVKDQHCCELWCRSQTWLRSCVAVACSYMSDLIPSLGTSICCGCAPPPKKKDIVCNAYFCQPCYWVLRTTWIKTGQKWQQKQLINQPTLIPTELLSNFSEHSKMCSGSKEKKLLVILPFFFSTAFFPLCFKIPLEHYRLVYS